MLRVGITGQSGFIGTHLSNYLGLKKDEIAVIPFDDNYFNDESRLKEFVSSCDAVVHLAAMNRHQEPQVLYETNVRLVKQLIDAMEAAASKPHVLFSSSTQEEAENPYGRSKTEGRELLEQWAGRNNASFTGLIIPNVYGPFGNPFYNSVVATFCYQLTHGEQPEILTDANLKLIYINELVEHFYRYLTCREENSGIIKYKVPNTSECKVSEILRLLETFRRVYLEGNCFPEIKTPFEFNLFNTYRSYIKHASHYPVKLKKNSDSRGTFIETVKTLLPGQFSFSTTLPGITRGNHFHIRKIERFIVIKGKAVISLRRIGTDEILKFDLDGEEPSFVDIPIWYTHSITNTGNEELITLFWINEFFDPDNPDTYFVNV